LGSGIHEIDPNGRPCFRPRAPGFPRLEDILDALDPAVAAVAEFERALAGWQPAGVIGRLFARLDAVHSSGAEGSTTTFTDLLEYESSRRTAADPDDAATVAACAEAFEAEAAGTGDPIERRSLSKPEYWSSPAARDAIACSWQTRSWISSTGFGRSPRAGRSARHP